MVRKVYRSMQGKVVDMELLSKANELTPAIGNAKMNARGDEIGPGGKIIRKREDLVAEYYDKTNSVREEQFKRPIAPNQNIQEVSEEAENSNQKKDVKNDRKKNKTNS